MRSRSDSLVGFGGWTQLLLLGCLCATDLYAQDLTTDAEETFAGCYRLEYAPPDPLDFRFHLPEIVELSLDRYNGMG